MQNPKAAHLSDPAPRAFSQSCLAVCQRASVGKGFRANKWTTTVRWSCKFQERIACLISVSAAQLAAPRKDQFPTQPSFFGGLAAATRYIIYIYIHIWHRVCEYGSMARRSALMRSLVERSRRCALLSGCLRNSASTLGRSALR